MKDGKGPRTVLELQARFPDEAACVEFLRKLRWPEGFVCPRCQGARELDDPDATAGAVPGLPVPGVADGGHRAAPDGG